jgi:O-methyltransferase involved in polyketide biosynthesis
MTEKIEILTDVPNAGRVYDYVLGGHHNFEADRGAANFMISLLPSTPKWVRMLRQFLREAVRQLTEEGFDKFLDLGSGLPTADHIHSAAPDAKVIYVDSDPVTVSYGMEILQGNPNVRYIEADMSDVDAILNSPILKEMFGDDRKVVIGLNAVTCFFSDEENKKIMQALYDWAAPGSKIFATFETKNPALTTPKIEQFLAMFNQMGTYYQFTTPEESKAFMEPWVVQSYKPLAEWLGVEDHFTEEDREGVELEFYGAIFEKK